MGVTAAAGCGGTVASAPQEAARVRADASSVSPQDAGASQDAAPEARASDGAIAIDAQVCGSPPASELLPETLHADAGALIGRGTFECCVADVSSFVSTDAGVTIVDLPDAAPTGAEVTSCCAAIVAHLDYEQGLRSSAEPDALTWMADQMAAAGVQGACCDVLGQPEGPTCTPWGPPTPPAMPARLREVA